MHRTTIAWMGFFTRRAALLAASLLAAACANTVDDVSATGGIPEGGESCDIPQFHLEGIKHFCITVTPDTGVNFQAFCKDLSGTLVTSCAKANALGVCSVEGFWQTDYADDGLTAADAEELCIEQVAHLGGKWTPLTP